MKILDRENRTILTGFRGRVRFFHGKLGSNAPPDGPLVKAMQINSIKMMQINSSKEDAN